MKLIVTIPCYNEAENIEAVIKEIPRSIPGIESVRVLIVDDGSSDNTIELARQAGADIIVKNAVNKGLAYTFKRALASAVEHGADIIVNTDGDNHYDQSRIEDLVKPILANEADIVIGSRKNLHTKNRRLNKIGSYVMTKWAGMPKLDVSTGFRSYTREAAMKLGVYSTHTYTHTTLLSALDLDLTVVEVPIPDRIVTRPSRLIKNVYSHIWIAGWNIVRNIVIFRPLRFFGIIGVLMLVVGAFPIIRFGYFWLVGQGGGHVQSLIIGTMFVLLGYINIVLGLLGSAIGWHRKVSEETLYRIKRLEDRLR